MPWQDRISVCNVDLFGVDLEDSTYLIPCFQDLRLLIQSVQTIGVINPPVVQRTVDDTLIPVLGRRRLLAARHIGLTTLEARILPPEMSEIAGFELAFWDNAGCRTFDQACTAFLVKRLLELFPRDMVAANFLPVLGIPPKGPRLERLAAIGGLELDVLRAVSSGSIYEKTAAILAEMESADRRAVLALTEQLRLNANRADEIITSLHDLAVFHGKEISELIRNEQCEVILNDRESSIPDKASRFRELIRSWKFPELVAKEHEFDSWRRSITDNNKIDIRPVALSESEGCVIEIRADDRSEAEQIIRQVKIQ